jgi:hypothetical protein
LICFHAIFTVIVKKFIVFEAIVAFNIFFFNDNSLFIIIRLFSPFWSIRAYPGVPESTT